MLQNKWVYRLRFLCMGLTIAVLSGCASIVSGTSQVVSVETLQKTGVVAGASCKLENDKGVYYVTTPGTVTVHRAYGDMNVKCEKAGVPDGIGIVKSATKGMMAGNILFGGFIGAGVDAASGAAYDYPTLFRIMMGETVVLPTPPVAPATPVASTGAAPTATGAAPTVTGAAPTSTGAAPTATGAAPTVTGAAPTATNTAAAQTAPIAKNQ